MLLTVFVVAVLFSATVILLLSLGPLKTAANVKVIRLIAGVQYAAAAALMLARAAGKA